ncbi:hypothetical protein D9756_006787 [Leucocoprinus leucothites]|uniref:CENP-V/GFA domain-containing protein n=1 Tax=Leucocoprinus leucothites TaxID=201217 RepID=A0A8H5LGQ6_9AGAR|nr:hypothetical protein D9756_006787 [Leucoagaricus leucothites]
MPHTGSCLCGQTKIELNTTHTDQYTCYCTDCRQASGSALSTNILAPQEDIKITGPVKEYKAKAASGNIVTRIFCENCGSAISHKSPMFKELQALQTGNFADFAKIPITMEGNCLCGATKVVVGGDPFKDQIVCHCTDCRQTSGSAFSTNILAPQKNVTITGPVKEYNIKAASGNTVTRIFCSECGSAISHKSAVFGDAQAIQTGNFADFANIPIKTELFVKDRWSGLAPIAEATQVQSMP